MTIISEEAQSPSNAALRPEPARRPTRRRWALVAASVVAVAGVAVGVVATRFDDAVTTPPSIGMSATPTDALENAARLIAYRTEAPGSGPIRHIRFRNLTDKGHPVYDAYIRPDGSAMVGTPGGPLEKTSGYLTSSELTELPADPATLRPALERLAAKRGYGFPDEAGERAIFRLAVDLLTDPGVTPDVRAGIYRVIADFDLTAIRARSLGQVTDSDGRPGIGLSFTFEEGATETLILDEQTGALLSDTTTLVGGTPFGGQTYLVQELLGSMPRTSRTARA